MRGEQIDIGVNGIHATGSPPLARGTGDICGVCWPPAWITPACAGNRQCDNLLHTCGWDHPRLRGEQLPSVRHGAGDKGSPPLARGTVSKVIVPLDTVGITPACAGNRVYTASRPSRPADHPRLRGEQFQLSLLAVWDSGSPPLARGTAAPNTLPSARAGITPACAGNSFQTRPVTALRWDHPRLRGEQTLWAKTCGSHRGSPPLARGTAGLTLTAGSAARITPACAGNRQRQRQRQRE